MSTVYSVRIPKRLREALNKLQDIDWQEELRMFLEQRVRSEYVRKQLEEAGKLRARMKEIGSAEIIREDRENAH